MRRSGADGDMSAVAAVPGGDLAMVARYGGSFAMATEISRPSSITDIA